MSAGPEFTPAQLQANADLAELWEAFERYDGTAEVLLDTVMDRDRLAMALTGAMALLRGVAVSVGQLSAVVGYLRDAPKPEPGP